MQRTSLNLFITVLTIIMLALLLPIALCSTTDDPIIRSAVRYGKVVGVFIGLAIYLIKVRFDVFGALLIGFSATYFISALTNGGSIEGIISGRLPAVGAAFFVRALAPQYKREILWGGLIFFEGMAIANLVILFTVEPWTEPLYPFGWQTAIAGRNSWGLYSIPGLFCSLFLDALKKRKGSCRTAVLFIIAIIPLFFSFSATTLLMISFGCVVFVLIQFKRIRVYCNPLTYTILYLAFFALIVLAKIPAKIWGATIPFIGKSTSLSGRTDIWDATVSLFDGQHALFGYYNGLTSPLVIGEAGGQEIYWSAHNAILDQLLWGGLILLAFSLAIFFLSAKEPFLRRSGYSAALCSLVLGVFLVHGLTEMIVSVPFAFWIAFIFAWFLPSGKTHQSLSRAGRKDTSLPCA